jgi:hypothetical protein
VFVDNAGDVVGDRRGRAGTGALGVRRTEFGATHREKAFYASPVDR